MRDIDLLHPQAQKLAMELLAQCETDGLKILITQTLRTKEEQDQLYAQGRTAPGKIVTKAKYPLSAHCWGLAFDFCRNVSGMEYDNSDRFFNQVGAIGKSLGLFWGGDFKSFTDLPHFELPEFLPNNSCNNLIEKYSKPESFIKTWQKITLKEEEEMAIVYEKLADIPVWGKATIEKLLKRDLLQGDQEGRINISQDMLRILIISDRAGLYDLK